MQDIFGSVRRSLVFRPPPPDNDESSTLFDKINSCIRKSRVFSKPSSPSMPLIGRGNSSNTVNETAPPIRWRKGELIGSGAFGRVYMGMNLDSGELLAVKEVLITMTSASKEKAQTHIMELEEEVKLLKNLSHPNIVRYLGTVREEKTLNILLEFVPGGSISSLLGKFGAFPEPVIRSYTKQLLLGLEYLHSNGIMHRDIKGANILVDNKGCIKLADFGASKQVVELATVTGAKSMKGTPYWMAPEVILQTGHNFSADIWSVGCTVIEMATGKPPWSQQYQEVAALFYIGTTKSHPPIPEHLSLEAKDFLLKCLQKEPNLRPAAPELLQHHFVTGGEYGESNSVLNTSVVDSPIPSQSCSTKPNTTQLLSCSSSGDICNLGSLSCSIVYPERLSESNVIWRTNEKDDEMCQIDDKDDSMGGGVIMAHDYNKSFNPMCEPSDDWWGNFDGNSELEQKQLNLDTDHPVHETTGHCEALNELDSSSYPCGQSLTEDDDILTESKITAFLDEKALELKKLQTPLYEEFYNSLNVACSPDFVDTMRDENGSSFLRLPPKSKSPNRRLFGSPSTAGDVMGTTSPGSNSKCVSNIGDCSDQSPQDIPSPQHGDVQMESISSSLSFSERQRKWKEELDQELERKREMMRHAAVGGKTSSPNDRRRDRTRFAAPGK